MLRKYGYLLLGLCLIQPLLAAPLFENNPISRLHIVDNDFIDDNGQKVRFWGVNLTAFYPKHKIADATAENLASLGINMVRPHHMMRESLDWNPHMTSGALVNYQHNSRQFDPEALDKFDYLNAALRKKGIYLAFSLNWSRSYHEGDVDILTTTSEDAKAWKNAWREIKSWDWRKQHDVVKSLSLIDERFIAIDKEFASNLLAHVNPYTNVSYAHDPQVATIEVINEYSAEYTFICNNKFPKYFHEKLQRKWEAFAAKKGFSANDFYQPISQKEKMLRLDFLLNLDKSRMQRTINNLRKQGFKGSITYSNLFRGENLLAMQQELANHIEDHVYANPFVVDKMADLFYSKSKSQLKGKPFIISEFNITENKELKEQRANVRTMLTAATVAYASFHNWSGVIWFSWQHGSNKIGADGWGKFRDRKVSIGHLAKDDMQLDHFKTAATIFRNGYITQAKPQITNIYEPYKTDNYHQFIAGKQGFKKGWQNIHSFRKSFASDKIKSKATTLIASSPPSVLVSDTNEIIKDIDRKQLTASTKKTEIFSGYLDNKPPAGLEFMSISKTTGFATVLLTTYDGQDLYHSQHLLISKTFFEKKKSWPWFNKKEKETDQLPIILKTGIAESNWEMEVTRPINEKRIIKISAEKSGELILPQSTWYEAEIRRTVPPIH